MSHRHLPRLLPVAAVIAILALPGLTWAQESVQLAQTLYASASYDEALAVLDRLQQQRPEDVAVRAINQQRALCLLALGRSQEAELAIAAVIQADPSYKPGETSVSPRVRAAFRDVRTRLLPEIVKTQYAEARRLYDDKRWAEAAPAFELVSTLAGDPELDEAGRGAVADIRKLSEDFAKLAAAAAAPPPEPPRAPPAPVVTAPVEPAVDYDRIYMATDPGVVPAVTLKQELPAWSHSSMPLPRAGGVIEVVVGKNGYVERATVTQPMAAFFDRQVLDATKNWRYEPATLNGHAVRFRKAIRINFE